MIEILAEYLSKGFVTMLTISMPCVLVAAGIGLVVGILQAVTQVQEQTIAAAPKILGVFLVIIVGGFGFVRLLTNLFYEGMALAFNGVTKNDHYALPSGHYQYTSPFAGEMKDRFQNIDEIDYIMRHPGKIPFISNEEKLHDTGTSRMPNPTPDFNESMTIIRR
ncbi:flagellar biosynthetic protein FliQ [bacterium]|nr:flagellar biosynthetic protein FliQ [bacterium]